MGKPGPDQGRSLRDASTADTNAMAIHTVDTNIHITPVNELSCKDGEVSPLTLLQLLPLQENKLPPLRHDAIYEWQAHLVNNPGYHLPRVARHDASAPDMHALAGLLHVAEIGLSQASEWHALQWLSLAIQA